MTHSSTSIDTLLRYHTDDPVIIEAMIEQYHSMLYRLALSILSDPAEADDAVQDAFLNAALHLNSYTIGTNFKAWLHSITINTCRGYLRKKHTRQNMEALLRSLHLIAPAAPAPEEIAMENEIGGQLWAAMGELSEKHQLVVILRIVHELPVSEIAYLLGIKEKTVYTRLYDAFRKMRKQLKASPDFDWLTKESLQ